VLRLCESEGWLSFPADPARAVRALTAPGVITVVAGRHRLWNGGILPSRARADAPENHRRPQRGRRRRGRQCSARPRVTLGRYCRTLAQSRVSGAISPGSSRHRWVSAWSSVEQAGVEQVACQAAVIVPSVGSFDIVPAWSGWISPEPPRRDLDPRCHVTLDPLDVPSVDEGRHTRKLR
jgi:hypothetical protein